MKPLAVERQDLLASLRSSSLERDDSGEFRKYIDTEGKEYYSVTTILSNTIPEAKRRSLEKWKSRPGSAEDLELACNRGTISHEHCEYVLKVASKINSNICNARNCWKFYEDGLARGPQAITKKCIQTARERASEVHWTARKYAKNLAHWIEENVAAIHASEFSIHHPSGFAGQSDALIDYGSKTGNLCILDFKTSGSKKEKPEAYLTDYLHQLSAYAWGLEEMAGIRPTMGVIVIARENGIQVREVSQLELLGGKQVFQERLTSFQELMASGSL
jgi:ATP-dependent exoDNAse (exonuclease V) beta subunit